MTAQTMLAKAASQLGYVQHGNTPYGLWYGGRHNDPADDAADWCAMFQGWCGFESGQGDVVGEFAWVPSYVEFFKNQGLFGHTPKVGALIFMDFEGGSEGSHVGIVEKIHSDGTVGTIEGNTGTPGQVARRTRAGDIIGYGYPAYHPAQEPDVAKHISLGMTKPITVKANVPVTIHWDTLLQDDTGLLVAGDPSLLIDAGHTTPFEACVWLGGIAGSWTLFEVDPVTFKDTDKAYPGHGAPGAAYEVGGSLGPKKHLWMRFTAAEDGVLEWGTARLNTWPN